MQHKYNMALQHFYEAAVTNDPKPDFGGKLSDLSDEEIFTSKNYNEECFEMQLDVRSKRKKRARVETSQPQPICTRKSCAKIFLVFLLFVVSLCVVTYVIQVSFNQLKPRPVANHMNNNVINTQEKIKDKSKNIESVQACSDFKVGNVWQSTFDKFESASAIRLVDFNRDGTLDMIQGFGTSLRGDGMVVKKQREVCEAHFSHYPCFGGVMALDGKTGKQIWIRYSQHKVTSINCDGDLDGDGVADCLCAGKFGLFEAVAGATGSVLWMFLDKTYRNRNANLYTPQFIHDLDGDNILDVLQLQGGDTRRGSFAKHPQKASILFMSGAKGHVLKSIQLAGDSYFSLVVYQTKDGMLRVVYGTGSEKKGGALWVVGLLELFRSGSTRNAVELAQQKDTGFMVSPVLVDVNNDDVTDLIVTGLNQKVVAYDGETLQEIWTYQTQSDVYSIPAPGYFNDDGVVDFLVRTNLGPGYPVYYDSKLIMIDGSNGKEITQQPNKQTSSSVSYTQPSSVSMQGTGNDLFVYWTSECEHHQRVGGAFDIVEGTDIRMARNLDTCVPRFGSNQFSRLSVMNRRTGMPGRQIHFSKMAKPARKGLQRMVHTVAPSLTNASFDVLAAVHSVVSPAVRTLNSADLACVQKYRDQAEKGEVANEVNSALNKENGFHDLGDTAVNHCLQSRYSNGTDDAQSYYNKIFNKGSMTVYRYTVTCQCDQGSQCPKVLPFNEQGWTGDMGSMANGYFKKRRISRFL